MLRQNDKHFYKGLYITFKLAPDLKKNTVYLSNYSPLNEGHISILTNSMLLTYICTLYNMRFICYCVDSTHTNSRTDKMHI